MTHRFADIACTDGVKAVQGHYGSRANNERLQSNFGPNDQLTPREANFMQMLKFICAAPSILKSNAQ